MGQETELWEKETSVVTDRTAERKPMKSATGRDMPSGDGDVGDEQVNAIGNSSSDKPIGQDHSTEGHERTEPTDGVGGVQDDSQPTKSRAAIEE